MILEARRLGDEGGARKARPPLGGRGRTGVAIVSARGMPTRELARVVALILSRADQGDTAFRESAIRIARILKHRKETVDHAD